MASQDARKTTAWGLRTRWLLCWLCLFVWMAVVFPASADNTPGSSKGTQASSYSVPPSLVADPAQKRACNAPELSWPLPSLTKSEREARLSFFMNTQEFTPDKHKLHSDPARCGSLLNALKKNKAVRILEPIETSSIATASWKKRSVMGCQELTLDRVFVDKRRVLDKTRDKDTSLDRNKDFFLEATANFELYDVSSYLGGKAFAYYGEGVVRRERQGAPFERTDGTRKPPRYELSSIEQLFNAKSCALWSSQLVPSPRILPVHRKLANGQSVNVFLETPSFFALADISGHLYRLAFIQYIPWSSYSQLTQNVRTAFISIAPLVQGEEVSEQCLFSSTD